jgi:CRISPR-associated protein (TIGR02710 family)
MKKALLISVGLGRGVENAIYFSVKQHNPSIVVFIATRSSLTTLERRVNGTKISELLEQKEVIQLEDEEDLYKTYHQVEMKIDKLVKDGYETSEIAVDITTGTKVMSAALAAVAIVHEVRSLSYVTGNRNADGRVVSGTEKMETLDPARISLLASLKRELPTYFNAHQYTACLDIIGRYKKKEKFLEKQEIQQLKDTERLVMGYREWDRFNHKGALEKLEKLANPKLSQNVKFLNELMNERNRLSSKVYKLGLRDNLPTRCLIADLIANAERRADEGSYDDAVARLYRAVEAVAQLHLLEVYGQDSGNIRLDELKDRLPEDSIKRYEKLRGEDGRIRLGLTESYQLIHTLEPANPLASDEVIEQLRKDLPFRNSSILAHGFKPIGREEFEKMKKLAIKVAKFEDQELEKRLLNARFQSI